MKQHDQNDHATIAERLQDLGKLEAVLTEAGRQAVLEHARAGRPIPVWRNNQVVWESLDIADQKHHERQGTR